MMEERPPLGGRYSVQRPLEQSSERFFAVEINTGKRVVVALLESSSLATLERAKGIRHRHLAGVIDVFREFESRALPPEARFSSSSVAIVAEHVPGRTLHALLAQGALNPAKAVAWTLRLAEALQALHQEQVVHGAVSPRSVLAEPLGRAIAPVLSQLIAPPLGAYSPPERLKGAPESASDDVWGLYATLYAALTGHAPFKASTREALLRAMLSKPKPLSAFGVNEPVLQEILQRGLLPDRHARATELAELIEVLDGWERDPRRAPVRRAPPPRAGLRGLGDIVGGTLRSPRNDTLVIDDSSLPDDQGTDLQDVASPAGVVLPVVPPPPPRRSEPRASEAGHPPPERMTPSSPTSAPVFDVAAAQEARASDTGGHPPLAAPVKPRLSLNPFARKRSPWPLAVGAALVVGAIGLFFAVSGSSDPKPEVPVTQAPTSTPTPKAAASSARNPAKERDSCVAAHFPAETFDSAASFAFVCEEEDTVSIARRLSEMAQTPSDAQNSSSPPTASGLGLEWYELPATAIIRSTCCAGSAPVSLPKTTGKCDQLEDAVRRMADDSQRAVDLAPGARAFDKAVACVVASRAPNPYPYKKQPSPASRAAFQKFLSQAAIVSARR